MEKRTQVRLAKHMTGTVEAAGQLGMLFACRNWQGIRNCPIPKRNCFWFNLLPQSAPSLGQEKGKKKKKNPFHSAAKALVQEVEKG